MRRQPKLTLIGPLIMGLILLVVFGSLARGVSDLGNTLVSESLTSNGRAQVSLASRALFNPLYQLDVTEIDSLISQYVQETEITYLAVHDDGGELVTEVSDSFQPDAAANQNLIAQALAQQDVAQQELGSFLLVVGPIAVGPQQIGTITIAYDMTILRGSFQPVLRLMNTILLIVFVATVFVITLFMRWGTRRLAQLVDAAGELGAGNLEKQVEVGGFQELATVGEAMENMRLRILSFYQDLERRVADRTRALETSAEVSRRLSALLEPQQLAQEVVDQIQNTFSYYHTQIYFLDQNEDQLVLVGGTGEAGDSMIATGHKLSPLQGLVGRVAATKRPVFIPDVRKDPMWLTNPLLPDTMAEVAVPITLDEQVLGVLDVQHDKIGVLNQESIDLLSSIANQVAIALQNARQYQQTQESEKQMREVLASVSIPLVIAGTDDGKILYANEELAQVVRRSLPDLQLAGLPDLFANKADQQIIDDQIQTQGFTENVELQLQRSDGELFWGLMSTRAITFAGNPANITSFIDISDRKLAEQAVQEAQARTAAVLESINVPLFITRMSDNALLYANEPYAAVTKMSRDKLLLQQTPTFWADTEQQLQWSQELEQKGFAHNQEIQLQQVEGGPAWALLSGETINFQGERAIITSLLDISDRKAAEQQLQQEQTRIRAILESINVPVMIVNVADNTLAYVNEPLANMLGQPPDKLRGNLAPDFYLDATAKQRYLAALKEQGRVANFELQLRRGDGERFWALLSGQTIEFQGERAVMTTFIDVTERRAAQEAVAQRATELETVSQVGTATATILDPNQLLQEVVDLTREKFDLYHAHIYMMDEEESNLMLTAGSGTVGRRMVAEGRHIPLSQQQSLVARAARDRRGVTVNDVQDEPGFLPNPLLPQTRAEMAVPLTAAGQVLGVLDVQAAEVARFTATDISIFTTLANQVAVALRTARRYEETQRAVDELTRLQRVMAREGWDAFMTAKERTLQGYSFERQSAQPILPENAHEFSMAGANEETAVSIPLSIRGEPIGQLGLRDPAGNPISPAKRILLTAMAQQVAEALERARLSEETQQALTETEKRSQELAVLNEMASTLTAQTDVDAVLDVVYEYTSRLMASDEFYVAFYDETSETVEFAFTGSEGNIRRHSGRRQAGHGITEYVLRQRRSLLMADQVDEHLTRLGIASVGRTPASWLGAPLLFGNEIIGVISLQSYSQPGAFTTQHLKLLTTIANQAAISIENVRLIEATEKRALQEQLLREITTRVSTAVDADSILRIAAQEVGRAFGLETFVVLTDGETQHQGGHTEPNGANGAEQA